MTASTQHQALSALVFLYRPVLGQDLGWLEDLERAKKPARLPVVFPTFPYPSPECRYEALGSLGTRP